MAPPRPAADAAGVAGEAGAPGPPGAGAVPALSGMQLLGSVAGLDQASGRVTVREFRRLPSAALTIADVLELAGEISGEAGDGAAGAVVVQGTDTIEETAFLLDLVHTGDTPVVVTGAMRHPGLAGPDGPANILAAVTAAASPALRGIGAAVVMADEVHAARFARKMHASSVSAFASPVSGPIALVAEGEVTVLTRPPGRWRLPVLADPGALRRDVRVGLVTVTLGDDGELVRAAAGRYDGLVVAGFGVGHVPPWLVDDLAAVAARIPVVLASRTGAGLVLREMYGFAGSERDLRSRGLTGAGFLDPLKARLMLHVLIAAGAGREEIARAFQSTAGPGGP